MKFTNLLAIFSMFVSGVTCASEDLAKGPPCKVLSELDGTSVVVSILGLEDCWEYSGTLDLMEDTAFKAGGKDTIVPAGLRSALLKQETDRSMVMAVDVSLEEYGFPFRLPRGFSLPSEGDFYLPSDQTGQPLDINGSIVVDEAQTEEYTAIESCPYSVLVYACLDDGCGCHTEDYDDGEMRVRYFFEVTETQLLLELLQPGGSLYMGDFSSSIFEREKIYTYQSTCFQRRIDDWRC